MAATERVIFKLATPRAEHEEVHHHTQSREVDEIDKKVVWLKTKLKEGPIDGPGGVKTYREDIRQILFTEFRTPISDLEIGVVVRKAFPRHSRKGKYYFGIGALNAKHDDKTGRIIATDNPKSLMTIQSDGESREPSPVMLKPVKKRAIQAWKETENGQAFAADQMIRDASSQASTPVVSVATSDGLVRPTWQPMLVLPQHLHMPPRGMLFPTAGGPPPPLPHSPLPIHHALLPASPGEPNNNVNRTPVVATARPRKRASSDVLGGGGGAGGGSISRLSSSSAVDRPGKKPRKEAAMVALSSSRNGIINERNNLTAKHIQPIILDFDVALPKLPPASSSSSQSSSGTIASSSSQNSLAEAKEKGAPAKARESLSSMTEERQEAVPVSPRPAEGADSSQSRKATEERVNKNPQVPPSTNTPESKASEEPSLPSAESSSADLFKKPNIEDYRSNVSAGRCFMCQNPIPPNPSKEPGPPESAILSICMKCKKVAMSGANSFKPVPKFPYACNPKLAPRTVYVPPPRRVFRPRPPTPKGPQKAVGIRLYPPRTRTSSSSSTTTSMRSPSPSVPPRSPGQMSMPGSPAPSMSLGSPQPCSPALVMHSAPPSPKHASDANIRTQSLSLPPSPSRIPLSPMSAEARELEAARRPAPVISLRVPSPAYSSGPSTPGGRESDSSERLSLPPGREQDDATIKALLQLGRGVDRSPSEYSYDGTPVPSPTGRDRDRDRDSWPPPHHISSIPIPHPSLSLPQPHLMGQMPLIPSNAGVVMGPQGQLLPIVPSWPPMGVHTSDGMISAAGFPGMPLLLQPPITRESSSPSSNPDSSPSAASRSRRTELQDSAKASPGSTQDGYQYDLSQLKHRKALKRCRVSEGTADSSPDRAAYRGDSPQEKSKSKHSIVVVGTNCAGSSFVKLNDPKEPSYHHHHKASEAYGKAPGTFSCLCTGHKIMLLQCGDCDFVCNKEFEMEMHRASQRHTDSRSRTAAAASAAAAQETFARHAAEVDDRDDMTSQSSVETQSADTDTDAASPPPAREPKQLPWSRVSSDTSSQVPLSAWPTALPFPPRASQASFLASSYGTCNLGTVTENTVPLDLSGRTFPPTPYLAGLPGSPFLLKEHRKEGGAGEETSPLDLSVYSKPSLMPSMAAGRMMSPFFANSKLGTPGGGFTPKKTPLDFLSSQPSATSSSFSLTSSGVTKPPQTFFDLMRLHQMPIPTTALAAMTSSSSKTSQAPISPNRTPTSMRTLTGLPSLSLAKAHPGSSSSPKLPATIPSIVLSSSSSGSPKTTRVTPYPTTELTRPPPGIIAPPASTLQQSLSYQGGTISVRPTIPVPQMLVTSKTVPVLSPFPLPVPVLPSPTETKGSLCRELPNMDSLSAGMSSPLCYTGSPSRGSPNIHESPRPRPRQGVMDHSSRRELSPLRSPHPSPLPPSPQRSPQQVHIKIEPPDTPQETDLYQPSDAREHHWQESERQARLLDAHLLAGAQSPSVVPAGSTASAGIGRTSWAISSKSLQLRDSSAYTSTTSGLAKAEPPSPQEAPSLSPSRTSPRQDLTTHSAQGPSGMHRTSPTVRDTSERVTPTANHLPDESRDSTASGSERVHGDATTDAGKSKADSDERPENPSSPQVQFNK